MAQGSTLALDHNRGQTPLWKTFESEFNHDDVSDDTDDDMKYVFTTNNEKQDTKPKIKQKKKTMGSATLPPTAMLHIDHDFLAVKPKLLSSISVPIKDMKYHSVDALTIWSNHRQELNDLLHKKKGINNVQRMYLIKEMINTEECYVKGLNTLLYEFVIPIIKYKLIDIKYKESITCNIPQLLLFHGQFLDELMDNNNKSLVTVFYKLCDHEFVDMYTKYTKEYQTMLDVYAKYNKSKKLQKYLKGKRKEKKPLTNHLILPIQRVTRYLLLLQELKRKTPSTHRDYHDLESVLDKINETVHTINERQREIENMSQCLQVQETMNGLNTNIVKPQRKLLHQFVFRKKENQRGRQFFVFNDLLIITNLKLKVKAVIGMRTIEIKREEMSVDFHLYSLDHDALYETDEIQDLDYLDLMIEDNRCRMHQQELRRVGADDMAKLLTNTHSVSGGSLKMFKSQTERSDKISATQYFSD